MKTIDLVAQLREDIDPEVVVKLRGKDENPVTISNWVMTEDSKWSTDKDGELVRAVDKKPEKVLRLQSKRLVLLSPMLKNF